jgi:hypothetical protein
MLLISLLPRGNGSVEPSEEFMASDGRAEGEVVLSYARPRAHQPWWVKLGLWGLPSRRSAWLYFWLCVVVAGASAVLGFRNRWCFLGTPLLVSAYAYWATIRWVDRHGGWSQVKK